MSEIVHVPEPPHRHCPDLEANRFPIGTVAICDCGTRCVSRMSWSTVSYSLYWSEEPERNATALVVGAVFSVLLIVVIIWAVLG